MKNFHLAHIFQPYYRTPKARERTGDGLGLGLFIAKGLVEAQGGRIWVKSQPGVGTPFGFTLPVPSAVQDSPAPASAPH